MKAALLISCVAIIAGCNLRGDAEGAKPREVVTLLPAPDYGDALYVVAGPSGEERVHRLDAEGWRELGGPSNASLEADEALIDGELHEAPDGRLYLLTERRVLAVGDGEHPELIEHAQLPPRQFDGDRVNAFAAGRGGELWLALPVEQGQELLRYADDGWSPIELPPLGDHLVDATVDRAGQLWIATPDDIFRLTDSRWERTAVDLRPHVALHRDDEGGAGAVIVVSTSFLSRLDATGEVLESPTLELAHAGHEITFGSNLSGHMAIGNRRCDLEDFELSSRTSELWRPELHRCRWLGAIDVDGRGQLWLDAGDALLAVADRSVVARYGRPASVRDLRVVGQGPRDRSERLDRPGPEGRYAPAARSDPNRDSAPLSNEGASAQETMRASELITRPDPNQPEDLRLSLPPVLARPRELHPIEHSPASEVLVISADRAPTWIQSRPEQVEYETWIWRPIDPVDPVEPVEPVEPVDQGAPAQISDAVLERRAGVFVSDGSGLWQVRVVARSLALPRCDCDSGDAEGEAVPVTISVVELRAPGEQLWQPLFGDVEQFAHWCDEAPAKFESDHHLLGVAGSQLLFMHVTTRDSCEEAPSSWTQFEVRDLRGPKREAANLLAELPGPSIDDARRRASLHLYERDPGIVIEVKSRWGAQWWPHALSVAALVPDFGESPPRVEIVFRASLPDAPRIQRERVNLQDSSSLWPPADASALLQHAGAQAEVIGWSRTAAPLLPPVEGGGGGGDGVADEP